MVAEHQVCEPSSKYSVQSLSHVQLFVTPRTTVCQASLSITNSWSLLKLISIALVMPSNHLILCCPLLLLPSVWQTDYIPVIDSILPFTVKNVTPLLQTHCRFKSTKVGIPEFQLQSIILACVCHVDVCVFMWVRDRKSQRQETIEGGAPNIFCKTEQK